MGSDGKKLSKSLGNYTDPNEVMDKYGADALRYVLLQSPLLNGEDFTLVDKDVADVARKLSMVWNMYDFFTMYADVDGWEWNGDLDDPTPDLENPLDLWIVSRIHQLNDEIQKHMNGYDISGALKPLLPFIDDTSNWYVRRSRRRFWKSESDDDKNNAYRTLHYVLVQLSMLMAPFTPFLSDELYQKLTGGESVHLQDWPQTGHVNELLIKEMTELRSYVNQGLSLRAQNQLKVRQPLPAVTIPETGKLIDFAEILTDELNVKTVKTNGEFDLDLSLTPELKREGMLRETIRHIQNSRKQAELKVDDRIVLHLKTNDDELNQAIKEHDDTLKKETLVTEISDTPQNHCFEVKVDGVVLQISLQKAG